MVTVANDAAPNRKFKVHKWSLDPAHKAIRKERVGKMCAHRGMQSLGDNQPAFLHTELTRSLSSLLSRAVSPCCRPNLP
jgi:hypothetical protein